MKIIYKIFLINVLVIFFASFALYKNREWYRGKIDFFIEVNKPSMENLKNPEFLLKETDYKLTGKVLSSKTFKENFIKKVGCSYSIDCNLIISWQYKRSAIHNFHMEFISNKLDHVKKALEIFPKEAYNFLNERNRNVIKVQIVSLKKSIEELQKNYLTIKNELISLYTQQKIQNENLIKMYFTYLKEYIDIKRKKIELSTVLTKGNVYEKGIIAKEKILKEKIKQLEDTLFGNNLDSLRMKLLKRKLDILTNTYIKIAQKIAFYQVLYEKGNIYYLFVTNIKFPKKAGKPNFTFIIFWWITFNISLILLFLLLRKRTFIRG